MFYKFLNAKDIDRVLRDNTVLISSLKYFRELEKSRGPWIGDELEGSTRLKTPPLTLTEGSPELEMMNRANIGLGMFKEGFAKASGGGRIDMGGVTFVHQVPPMHIYSYAYGNFDKLKQAMCVDAVERYDACLHINDHEALLKAIYKEGEILEIATPARVAFKAAGWAEVSYDEVERDITAGPVIPPSPFKKALRFASQCEYRYAFDPAMEGLPERIVVRVPNLGDYFKVVFRDFRP